MVGDSRTLTKDVGMTAHLDALHAAEAELAECRDAFALVETVAAESKHRETALREALEYVRDCDYGLRRRKGPEEPSVFRVIQDALASPASGEEKK